MLCNCTFNATRPPVIPLYVSEEIWGELKLLAVKKQTNMNELCREEIEYILKKYKNLSLWFK